MPTISFINFKGGVGKTTLCVEIAAALAGKMNEPVLVVDLDPQSNATFYLIDEQEWERRRNTTGTLRDFYKQFYDNSDITALPDILEKLVIKDEIAKRLFKSLQKHIKLELVPSDIELFGMDMEIIQKYGNKNITTMNLLHIALSGLEKKYSFILIDCPPNMYLSTQNGIISSDYYAIVALPEYLSTIGIGQIIHSVTTTLNLYRNMGGSSKKSCRLLGIIFNKVKYRTGGAQTQARIMDLIKREYGEKVFETWIPTSDRIASRPEIRIPIALSGYAQDEEYEKRIKQLAEEFYDRVTSP